MDKGKVPRFYGPRCRKVHHIYWHSFTLLPCSALEIFFSIRYINLHFASLLTYLLVGCSDSEPCSLSIKHTLQRETQQHCGLKK